MNSHDHSLAVWLIDPISYSGMAYSDVGQIVGLKELGAAPVLVGSDEWMLAPNLVPRIVGFRGTIGRASRLRRGIRYVSSLIRLVGRMRRQRPDIVHWQMTELPLADLIAMLAIRISRIPQVYTAHELLPWSAAPHHRLLFSRLYRLMDATIVHNDNQRDELIDRFKVPPARIHVVPLGDYTLFATPNLSQSDARAQLGVPGDVPVALFFGTIRPSKGLEVLLEAWAIVVDKLPEARLLVAGKPFKGLDVTETTALIHSRGIEQSVTTRFEQVNPVETNAYYRATDILVLPYHAIGTSGVLRYAYNSGRAIIATTVGEHPSRVIDGDTGILIPPSDPVALATALLETLGDRSRTKAMGESARLYAETNFKWLDSAQGLLDVYMDLHRRTARRARLREGSSDRQSSKTR